MNEGNDLEITFGKSDVEPKDVSLQIVESFIVRKGKSLRQITLQGVYSATNYMSNPRKFISTNKSGIEVLIEVAQRNNFAIDFDPNAIELTKKNLEKFNVSNVTVILGNAKDEISKLPQADSIFIGGTGGDTKDIVKSVHS